MSYKRDNIGDKIICVRTLQNLLIKGKVYELKFGGKGGGGWHIICETGETLALVPEYHIDKNDVNEHLFERFDIKEARRKKLKIIENNYKHIEL